ncbi:unnamed protein product [Miscanthus lutarioriparius]|uniref:Uncharacterized protein n=1 Tax=Miscanthus lutarioriparius TaxID=422564 RepID=A0A811QQ70_9POAL|nr:unnamed protein product [Miscanthus lutarioriparius]
MPDCSSLQMAGLDPPPALRRPVPASRALGRSRGTATKGVREAASRLAEPLPLGHAWEANTLTEFEVVAAEVGWGKPAGRHPAPAGGVGGAGGQREPNQHALKSKLPIA